MKRSEIIGLVNETGQLMDVFDYAEIKKLETNEVIGTVSKDAIHGMQVAMLCCIGLHNVTQAIIAGLADMLNKMGLLFRDAGGADGKEG